MTDDMRLAANLGPITTGRLTAPDGEFIEFGGPGVVMSEGLFKQLVESYRAEPPADSVSLDPPEYVVPDWTPPTKYVHDWRRYIGDELQAAWQTFSPAQRKLLAENAQRLANNEEWD